MCLVLQWPHVHAWVAGIDVERKITEDEEEQVEFVGDGGGLGGEGFGGEATWRSWSAIICSATIFCLRRARSEIMGGGGGGGEDREDGREGAGEGRRRLSIGWRGLDGYCSCDWCLFRTTEGDCAAGGSASAYEGTGAEVGLTRFFLSLETFPSRDIDYGGGHQKEGVSQQSGQQCMGR